jgi:hypothetical protein
VRALLIHDSSGCPTVANIDGTLDCSEVKVVVPVVSA